MILLDTSGLLANYDRHDRHHPAVVPIMQRSQRRILSPFVLAELDYLVAKIAGQHSELIVLDDVARGACELASFSAAEVGAAKLLIAQYADLQLGLADASIVVLANRYHCLDVLTLDRRHFRVVSRADGKPFRLLPLDPEFRGVTEG